MKLKVAGVAQWLESATDNRVVAGSNPAEAVWKLWQFPLPHFASVFRKRLSRWCFYLVSMPGEVKYPTVVIHEADQE